MKRKTILLIACVILAALGLTRCGNKEITLRGNVTAIEQNNGHPLFIIRTAEEKEFCILTGENTYFHSWLESTGPEALLQKELTDPVILVNTRSKTTRFDLNEKTYPAYSADQITLLSMLETDGYPLPDGTTLDIRHHDSRRIYQTKEGVALLEEEIPIGPDRVYVGGVLSLSDLPEEAQTEILRWYQDRGTLYDLAERIQTAYDDWKAQGQPANFTSHHVSQEIYPCAYNEELIWFTSLLQSTYHAPAGIQNRCCEVFRQDTGEFVEMKDLFSLPEEKIGSALLDAADTTPEDLPDMKNAFRLDYLVFSTEYVEIWFPQGSFPGAETARIVAAKYEDLEGILHDWAVPTAYPE